ncbi:hypothetical protein [Pseudomonas gingeri]|uniref:hypothetical protein n=1 Tax=Pseudomonas gingeri TaxID=117681 RepID=UPI0015A2DB01|nr:hypothetical protein [Pseudomonas gingeri]NWD04953.1 hypothetical protein [Pseudomonas gingeri]NWE56729.1 hypothetical protein [Pseudomonas gingeri]NWF05435.1 hypothetical protein [Pseudomonas gingeri]
MIPEIIAKLETNPSYTNQNASTDLADVFGSVSSLAENVDYLRSVYDYLRVRPELSRALFDELINRHNKAGSDISATQFVPGCCCCGIDPYEPERQLGKDITVMEANLIASGLPSIQSATFLNEVASYRAKAHARASSIGTMKVNKQSMGAEFLNRLTTPTQIEQAEADYLYAVLERNECIGEDLFEYAFSGARLAALANRPAIEDSPVVASIRSIFGGGGGGGGNGGGGGGGGGCCCCCCCCCCGGGC